MWFMILFLKIGVCSCWWNWVFCWMNLKNWCFWLGYWCVWFMIVCVSLVFEMLIFFFWLMFVNSRFSFMWWLVKVLCLLVVLILLWLWFWIFGFFLCYSWCVIWFVFVLIRFFGRLNLIMLFSVFSSECFVSVCVVLVYFDFRCLVICVFNVFRFFVLNLVVSLLLILVFFGFLIVFIVMVKIVVLLVRFLVL